jgi:hypothetical protein
VIFWTQESIDLIRCELEWELTPREHDVFMILARWPNILVEHRYFQLSRNSLRVTISGMRYKLPWWIDIHAVLEIGYVLRLNRQFTCSQTCQSSSN